MKRQPQPCGTNAAYQRHLRRMETPCFPCRIAAAADRNRRYHNQRDVAAAVTADLLHQVIDLIAGECRRAGMLP